MKTLYSIWISILVLLCNSGVNAQSYKLDNETSTLVIEGTSNIHDWTIEAENTQGFLTTEFDHGELKNIEKLQFTVDSKSLMSGKSGMDKNTYKALNTDKYKEICFTLKEVKNIQRIPGDTYRVNSTGSLLIAGTKKDVNLNFVVKTNNEQIILNGQYELNMTDYGVEAPTAMFGTIKTGEEVVVKFESNFTK